MKRLKDDWANGPFFKKIMAGNLSLAPPFLARVVNHLNSLLSATFAVPKQEVN